MRTILIVCLSLMLVPAGLAKPGVDDKAYLLFPPEFRVVEITQVGVLPMLAAGALVEKHARTRFETGFSEAYGVRLIELAAAGGVDDSGVEQGLALLKRITRVVQHHLDPEDDGTFFEARVPQLVIGPAFRDAHVDGRPLEFGLSYSVVQYSFDDVRTRRVFGGDESKGFLISACVVRLDDGTIDHCRLLSAPGGYLLHRAGYFEGDEFSSHTREMLTDADFLVHEAPAGER